jgi:hypothetical protein
LPCSGLSASHRLGTDESIAALLFFIPEFLSAFFGDFTVPWCFPRRGVVDPDPLFLDRFDFTLTEGNDLTEVDPQDWSSESGVVSKVEPDIIRLRVRLSFDLFNPLDFGTLSYAACSTRSLLSTFVAIVGDGEEREGIYIGLSIVSFEGNDGDENVSFWTSEGGSDGIGEGERGLATADAFSISSPDCDRDEDFILFDRWWLWWWLCSLLWRAFPPFFFFFFLSMWSVLLCLFELFFVFFGDSVRMTTNTMKNIAASVVAAIIVGNTP